MIKHKDLKDAYAEWVSQQIENPVAVELMQDDRLRDPLAFEQGVRHFFNRLDRAVYGNAAQRFNKRIRRFAVLERGVDAGLHVHALIERPHRIKTDDYRALLEKIWIQKTIVGSRINFNDCPTLVYTNYILKRRTKDHYSDFMLVNCSYL